MVTLKADCEAIWCRIWELGHLYIGAHTVDIYMNSHHLLLYGKLRNDWLYSVYTVYGYLILIAAAEVGPISLGDTFRCVTEAYFLSDWEVSSD